MEVSKRKKRKIVWILLLSVALIFSICFAFEMAHYKDMQYDLYKKIASQCENSNFAFPMNRITDFEWDVAYFDREAYADGKKTRARYQLKGLYLGLGRDDIERIIFVSNGEIVKIASMYFYEATFSSPVEMLKPDTILLAEQRQHPYIDRTTIYLTVKE